MRKSILVTGIAGSGKSIICKELNKQGYRAYDIEGMKDLFRMLDKETGKIFENYDNNDLEKIKQGDWICDVNKLRNLIDSENNGLIFYCGTASNIDEILPLFDTVILLKVSPEVLHQRLSLRRPGDFGNTKEVQDWILGWKDWWEDSMRDKGAIIINGDGNPEEAVKNIIKIL